MNKKTENNNFDLKNLYLYTDFIKYDVVVAHSIDELGKKVNNKIKDGYLPYGNISSSKKKHGGHVYIREMLSVDYNAISKLNNNENKFPKFDFNVPMPACKPTKSETYNPDYWI